MNASIDLPSSTNGALLVLSVAGFGLSVHFEETFLASFFGGLITVTGLVWLYFLTLTVYRNMIVLEEESDYHTDHKGTFMIWYIGIVIGSMVLMVFVSELIG